MKKILLLFSVMLAMLLSFQQNTLASKILNPVAQINKNTGYVVFDLETTGLSPFRDEIIEIGAVKVDKDGKIIETFNTLVKPTKPITKFIQDLTGISNEMLENAPSIYTVLPKFADFAGDSVLVGHNVTFDIAFVQQKAKIYKDIKLLNPYVDTFSLTKKVYPHLKSYKLQDLIIEFDLKTHAAHRALADVVATQQLYELLKQEYLLKML